MKKFAQTFLKTQKKNFSLWGDVKARPADPILGLVEEYKKCTHKGKVNLSAGTYKTDEGNPYVLNCVKEVLFILPRLKKNSLRILNMIWSIYLLRVIQDLSNTH